MTHDDADITAIRTTLSRRVENTDASVARAWAALSHRETTQDRRVRPWLAGVLVPAGAAFGVAALALGITVLPGSLEGRGQPAGGTAAGAPSAVPTVAPTERLRPHQVRINEGLLVEGAPVAIETVLAEIVAAAADAAAVTVGEQELVYVRTVDHDDRTRLHEAWYDVDGMFPIDIKIGWESIAESEEYVGELFGAPPDLHRPTPQWLAELPTKPEAMLGLLRAETSPGPNASDRYVYKEVGQLLSRTDLLLVPEVRIALYQALGSIEAVSAVTLDVDGQPLYGLRHSHGGHADELLLDPATGRVVGTRVVRPGTDQPVISARIWSHSVVDLGEVGISR